MMPHPTALRLEGVLYALLLAKVIGLNLALAIMLVAQLLLWLTEYARAS